MEYLEVGNSNNYFPGRLTSLNVSSCTSLYELRCQNNQLTSLNIDGCTALQTLNCFGNQLIFSTLPPRGFANTYYYNGQRNVATVSTLPRGSTLDFSSEYEIDGTKTAYTWYYGHYRNNTNLLQYSVVPKSLYTAENGKFVFEGLNDGDVIFCAMANAKFPGLALTTSSVWIGSYNAHDLAKVTAAFATGSLLSAVWDKISGELRLVNASTGRGTLDLSGCTALMSVVIGNDPNSESQSWLSSLNVSGCTALRNIWGGGFGNSFLNCLTSLNASDCTALEALIFGNGNLLTSLNVDGCEVLEILLCQNNRLKYSTLEIPGNIANYNYGQPSSSNNYQSQQSVAIQSSLPHNSTLDLSSEYMIDGQQTYYSWYYANGNMISPNLYTNIDGKFEFHGLNVGHVIYCEMYNANFSGNGTYTIRVSGLDAGTKYTVNMQALDGNKYSKVTKVTASTAKYIAPKKDKVIPGLGEVTFSWKASTGIPAGTDREYTVGIFVGNDFIVFGSGDGTFTVDGVTITVAGTTATVTGLASQKYTFGIQEQVDITGDIAKSAIAKIIASPLPYKAPKFNIPAPVANGSTKLELKNASMTNPKTENQTYGYEVGVYDKTTKQYVWGEASVLTDGYTSEDGMDWTITGVTKGMKIALREILHAADGTVIAMSVMQKITLK